MFFTQHLNKPKRVFTNCGDIEESVYASRYDKEGNIELYEEHKRNNRLEIQSHRDSCDLMMLLARYEAGDNDALNQRNGIFVDMVGMPHNAVEMLNTMATAENEFMKLPRALREEFGNSITQFLAAMDDPKAFAAKLGKFGKAPTPVKEEKPIEKPAEQVESEDKK